MHCIGGAQAVQGGAQAVKTRIGPCDGPSMLGALHEADRDAGVKNEVAPTAASFPLPPGRYAGSKRNIGGVDAKFLDPNRCLCHRAIVAARLF